MHLFKGTKVTLHNWSMETPESWTFKLRSWVLLVWAKEHDGLVQTFFKKKILASAWAITCD